MNKEQHEMLHDGYVTLRDLGASLGLSFGETLAKDTGEGDPAAKGYVQWIMEMIAMAHIQVGFALGKHPKDVLEDVLGEIARQEEEGTSETTH